MRVCYPELLVSDLKVLEERIEALERGKRKSAIVKRELLELLLKALLPVTIAFAAHHVSKVVGRAHIAAAEKLKERDVASARELKERDVAVSMQHSRAQQASVVNTFMQALLSENTRHRQQAIKAVLIALPQDGPNLVDAIRATEAGSPIAQYAADALTQRRDDLITASSPIARTSASKHRTDSYRAGARGRISFPCFSIPPIAIPVTCKRSTTHSARSTHSIRTSSEQMRVRYATLPSARVPVRTEWRSGSLHVG